MDTRLTFRDYLKFDQDRCGDAARKSLVRNGFNPGVKRGWEG